MQRIADLEAYRASLEIRLAGLDQAVADNADDIADIEAELVQVNADIDALNIELAKKQDRVTGFCPEGSSIREVHSSGSVSCELDHDAQLINSYT